MENKQIVGGVVGLAVAVILVATLLVPIINSSAETETTFSNVEDSYGYMDYVDAEGDYTFSWTNTNASVATVNGETVQLFNGSLLLVSDNEIIRSGYSGSFGRWIQARGDTYTLSVYANESVNTEFTITISNGNITFYNVERTFTYPWVGGYCIAPTGDFVMKSSAQSAYLLADSNIKAMGLTPLKYTQTESADEGINIDGTVKGVTFSTFYKSDYSYNFTNVNIGASAVDNYVNLYQIEKITFDAVLSTDDSVTTACTYNYFVVPAEVTAEKSEHLDSTTVNLLGVIPVLVLVGLVVGAVGMFIRTRAD